MFNVGVRRPSWIFLLASFSSVLSQMPNWCWYTHHCPCLAVSSYRLGVAAQLQHLVDVGVGGGGACFYLPWTD